VDTTNVIVLVMTGSLHRNRHRPALQRPRSRHLQIVAETVAVGMDVAGSMKTAGDGGAG